MEWCVTYSSLETVDWSLYKCGCGGVIGTIVKLGHLDNQDLDVSLIQTRSQGVWLHCNCSHPDKDSLIKHFKILIYTTVS